MDDARPGAAVPHGRTSVWADPLMRLTGALSLVSTLWFVVAVFRPVEPVVLGWLLVPVCSTSAALVCWRSGTDPGLPAAARYFWRRAGVGLGVFSLSMLTQTFDSLNADLTMTSRLSTVSALGHAAGLGLLVWPLFRLPLGVRTRTQRVALWLDIGTVMVATAVFLWHFSARDTLGQAGQSSTSVTTGIALMVAGLMGVFVVAKVALTGTVSLERGALRLLGGALMVGGLGSPVLGMAVTLTYLDASLLIVPIATFMIALGSRRQVTVGTAAITATANPRRRYSLLPYVAVAATDALLLVAIGQDADDEMLVAAIAVALTGLVVVRQLSAFRENDSLLARLDAGLLELTRHERRFRSLVQNASDVVSISRPDGTVDYISPAVLRVLGHTQESLIGADIEPLVHPEDKAVVAANVGDIARRPGATATYQIRLAHADGSWRWLEVISANLLDDPSVGGIVSNSRDVTETREVQDRLSYEATHDVLTGLANRALFGERVQRSVADPDPDHRFTVVLIDLDDFKTVNDTLGHAVGDALLVAVAHRMCSSVRPGDTVARLGGDEFALLLAGVDPDTVDDVVVRIAEALREPVHVDEHRLPVRASFGVVSGAVGDDAGNLLRQADIAMYEAKDRGDGGYQRYRPGMEARGAERSRITAELRAGLEDDTFVLHYQPVVSLPSGRITGVEALVRWQHPVRGLLAPGDFIPAAEQTGFIVPLGRWVLREATRQAAGWLEMYGEHGPATVAVNASARQLQEAGFAAEVAAALHDSGLAAHRLTIEITESTAVGGGATQETLRSLRALGVRLSLDDFGTGQSTLSLLANCPVDQIKLDRSFAPVPGPDVIATAVVQLARALGVEAVAEGVETPAQAERLSSLGYEQAQGFHFARPMAPAAIEAVLSQAAGIQAPLTAAV